MHLVKYEDPNSTVKQKTTTNFPQQLGWGQNESGLSAVLRMTQEEAKLSDKKRTNQTNNVVTALWVPLGVLSDEVNQTPNLMEI